MSKVIEFDFPTFLINLSVNGNKSCYKVVFMCVPFIITVKLRRG